MQIILLKDFKKIGKTGEIKKVADGYAQNFLIPNKIAIKATDTNIKELKEKKNTESKKYKSELENAKKNKELLEKNNLEIQAKKGESDKLYGAITNKNISEHIKDALNIKIDKKKIILKEPIKKTGSYKVKIKLFDNISANINLSIKGQ